MPAEGVSRVVASSRISTSLMGGADIRNLRCGRMVTSAVTPGPARAGLGTPHMTVVIGQRARGGCPAGMWLVQERPPGAIVRAWCPNRSEEDVLWVRVAAAAA